MSLVKPTYVKPREFGDVNVWGKKLNVIVDQLDAFQKGVVQAVDGIHTDISGLEERKLNVSDVDAVVGNKVDNYITDTVKPDIDAYIENIKTKNILPYVNAKKEEVNQVGETKKRELTSHKTELATQLTNLVNTQKEDITTHTTAKKTELTNLTEEKKRELVSLTNDKKTELTAHANREITRAETEIRAESTTQQGIIRTKGQEEVDLIRTKGQVELDGIRTKGQEELDAIDTKSTQEQATIREKGQEEVVLIRTKGQEELDKINAKGQEEMDKFEHIGVQNFAQKTVTITAGKGLTGGGTLEASRTVDIVSKNDGIIVGEDDIELSLVNDITKVSLTKAPTSSLLKVVNDRIDALQTGGDLSNLNQHDDFSRIHHCGVLQANTKVINVGAYLHLPSLYLDGTRIDQDLFTIDSTRKIITLDSVMAQYDMRWTVEDTYTSYIKFSVATMSTLTASADIKSLINVGNVIAILGDNVENDGGHYLVECKATGGDGAVDIGNNRFLHKIKNTYIKDKLDRGGYELTAQDLKNDIDTKISIENAEKLVKDANAIIYDTNHGKKIHQWYGTMAEWEALKYPSAETSYKISTSDYGITEKYIPRLKPTEYYLSSISLVVNADQYGLHCWNNPLDPMTLKIANGKTIKDCIVEETDDYIIYSDGDVVTLENYVTGTYDEYNRQLKLHAELQNKPKVTYSGDVVDGVAPMLNVTLNPTIDHKKLLNDINNKKLEELGYNTPVQLMSENGDVVDGVVSDLHSLPTRIIPVPISFCCRVDKHTGEIYIGEGYENLFTWFGKYGRDNVREGDRVTITGSSTYGGLLSCGMSIKPTASEHRTLILEGKISPKLQPLLSEITTATSEGMVYQDFVRDGENFRYTVSCLNTEQLAYQNLRSTPTNNIDFNTGYYIDVKTIFMTKLLKVPPVKTIMPSGKLSFITSAGTDTNSFIVKDIDNASRYGNPLQFEGRAGVKGERYSIDVQTSGVDFVATNTIYKKSIRGGEFQDAKIYSKGDIKRTYFTLTESVWTGTNNNGERINSFKQFLSYKAQLTEQELKDELKKNIKMVGGI